MVRRWALVAVPLFSLCASAGVNTWTSVGPDGGSIYGGVRYLARPSTAIAATTRGIYRTTDSGQNWTRVVQFPAYGYYQGVATNWNPPTGDQVLAHGDGSAQILRSIDGGVTWTRANVASSTSSVSAAAFTRNGSYAWAGNADGRMFRSADGGATWTERSTGLGTTFRIEQIEVDANDIDTVYAMSNGELWRTRDAGTGWSHVNAANQQIYRIAAARNTHDVVLAIRYVPTAGIWRSTDGGSTFSLALAGEFSSVEFFPGSAHCALAVRGDGRAMFTDDDGTTWSARGTQTLGAPLGMSFDPVTEQNVMLATITGMAFSGDGGASWSVRNGGIRELDVGALTVRRDGANSMYALTFDDRIVWRRDPNSGSWEAGGGDVGSVVTSPVVFSGYGLAASPQLPGVLYIIRDGRFGRSIDDGAHWTALGSVAGGASITFEPSNPSSMFVAGTSDSFKTIDGGATWTPIGGGLPAGIADIVVDSSDANVLYAAKSINNNPAASPIYKSTDGGASWAPAGTGITDAWAWRLVGHPTQSGTLYAATQSGLWRTTSAAAGWTKIFSGSPGNGSVFDLAIDPQKPHILYLVSNGSPGDSARSIDGGATWESLRVQPLGASNPLPLYLALVPGKPSTLINARAAAGLHELTIAPDIRLSSSVASLVVGVPSSLNLALENAGPFSATDVTFDVILPASSAAITSQPGTGIQCTLNGQALSCAVAALKTGDFRTVGLTLTPSIHGDRLLGSALAYEPDSDPSNNLVDSVTERRADLGVTLTTPTATAETGTTYTMTLTVSNAGPSPAASIVADVHLPANVAFASASNDGLACTHAAGQVLCSAASIAVAGSARAGITVTAVTAGNANTTVSVIAEGADPASANDTAARSVTLTDPPPPPPPPPPGSSSGGGSSSSSSSSGGSGSSGGGASAAGGGKGGGRVDYLLVAMLSATLLCMRLAPLRRRSGRRLALKMR
jgi:uncharacterized repeat protein (TIGR01451 family)